MWILVADVLNSTRNDRRKRLASRLPDPKAILVPTERGRDEDGILKRDNGFTDV